LLLPSAFCLLPSAFFLLPSAFCLLPSSFFLLPSAFCLLPSAFFLLPSAIFLSFPPSAILKYLAEGGIATGIPAPSRPINDRLRVAMQAR